MRGNSINKKRVRFSNCSKRSYRATPVQPSVPELLDHSLGNYDNTSTMPLFRTLDMQQIGKSWLAWMPIPYDKDVPMDRPARWVVHGSSRLCSNRGACPSGR